MTGTIPLPDNEKKAKRAITLYFHKKLSLREVGEVLDCSPGTVSNWIKASGRKTRSRESAQRQRSQYPKDWSCSICGKDRQAKNWKELTKKTCSKKCWRAYLSEVNPSKTSSKVRVKAFKMKEAGYTYDEIAEKLKLGRTTVWRIFNAPGP